MIQDRGLIVPAFFGAQYRNTAPLWKDLSSAARKIRESLIVVASPYSGPGTAAPEVDSGGDHLFKKLVPQGLRATNSVGVTLTGTGEYWQKYVDAINGVRQHMSTVVGYVSTGYASRAQSEVIADIDTWFDWYSSNAGPLGLDGIFFDEVSPKSGELGYYQAIYNHVQLRHSGAKVINNFGAMPDQVYWGIGSSILCVHENTFSHFNGWQPDNWVGNTGQPGRFLVLAHTTGKGDLRSARNQAWNQKIGWLYFTHDVMPNPWDTLPCYFGWLVNTFAPGWWLGLWSYCHPPAILLRKVEYIGLLIRRLLRLD